MIHISREGRKKERGGEGDEGERERKRGREERRDLPIFSIRLMGRLRCLHGAALTCNTLHTVSHSGTQNPLKKVRVSDIMEVFQETY